MLKLATVFSGIGAIEHALERMGIEYEIVFASDNGGLMPFQKKIKFSQKEINNEVNYIKNSLKRLKGFEEYSLNVIESKLELIYANLNYINKSIDDFLRITGYNTNGEDKYKLVENIRKSKDEISMRIKSNKRFKSVLKEIRLLIKDLNQIHEVIGVLESTEKLKEMNSYKDKKEYIDSLYDKLKKENYVKITYMENYKISNDRFHNDVNFIDGNQYKGEVDLFVGGSPCQSFSMVGKRRGLEDTRGTLFYDYARLIKEIQPKVFIYENVKGLLSHDGGNTWDVIKRVFNNLGYNWSFKTLNSKNFGIPQNRERLFVVGFRNDLLLNKDFEFPKEVELTLVMKDFLLDNVSGKYYLNHKGVKFVTSEKNLKKRFTQIDGEILLCQKANQQFNWHGDFVFVEENSEKINKETMDQLEKYFLSEKVKKYVLKSGTKGFYSKPEINLNIARPLLQTMHKMHRAGVDNYVETEGRLRKLTPRECLRLMGFCDSFVISVSDTQMYRQAGNSIVVDVLIAIIDEIDKVIKIK